MIYVRKVYVLCVERYKYYISFYICVKCNWYNIGTILITNKKKLKKSHFFIYKHGNLYYYTYIIN